MGKDNTNYQARQDEMTVLFMGQGCSKTKAKNRAKKTILLEREQRGSTPPASLVLEFEHKTNVYLHCREDGEIVKTYKAQGTGYNKFGALMGQLFNDRFARFLWKAIDQKAHRVPYGVEVNPSQDWVWFSDGGIGTAAVYEIIKWMGYSMTSQPDKPKLAIYKLEKIRDVEELFVKHEVEYADGWRDTAFKKESL